MRANILYNVGAQSGIIILIASSFGHTQFGYRLIFALAAVVLIAAAFLVLKVRENRGNTLRPTTPALAPRSAHLLLCHVAPSTLDGSLHFKHEQGRHAVSCVSGLSWSG